MARDYADEWAARYKPDPPKVVAAKPAVELPVETPGGDQPIAPPVAREIVDSAVFLVKASVVVVATLAAVLLAIYLCDRAVASVEVRGTEFMCRRAVQEDLTKTVPSVDPQVVKCEKAGDRMICVVTALNREHGSYRTNTFDVDCSKSPPSITPAKD